MVAAPPACKPMGWKRARREYWDNGFLIGIRSILLSACGGSGAALNRNHSHLQNTLNMLNALTSFNELLWQEFLLPGKKSHCQFSGNTLQIVFI